MKGSGLHSGYYECRCLGCGGVCPLLVTANVVPFSLMLSTLMMEAIRSSKTSVLTRAIQRHVAEAGILHY
jgi:hypothetical protein